MDGQEGLDEKFSKELKGQLTWPTSFMKFRYISISNLPRGLVMETAGKLATMSPVAAAASVCRIMLS